MDKPKVTNKTRASRVSVLSQPASRRLSQKLPSTPTMSRPTAPRGLGGTRASPKEQSPKPVEEDDELEDESIVEDMTVSNAGSDEDEENSPEPGLEQNSNDGGAGCNDEEPGTANVDSPPAQTEKPENEATGSSSSTSQATKEGKTTNPLLPLSFQKPLKSGRKPKPKNPLTFPGTAAESTTPLRSGSRSENKEVTVPPQPKWLGPTPVPVVLVKTLPPSKATPSVSSPLRKTPTLHKQLSPEEDRDHFTIPNRTAGATAPKDTNPSKVAPPKLNQNETPAEPGKSPEGSRDERSPIARSPKSDIESLYASPSPKPTMDSAIEPIELDSDPDFEMMEQMLLSHRGPQSSQIVKNESLSQPPAIFQNSSPLKRQRSHPSPLRSSQTQTDPKPAKRPRVQGSRPLESAAVLNDRKKHPEFWDLDGTVVLQVDDVIFRVMRSTLSKASPWFQRLFSEDFEHLEVMAGCPLYLIEEDLSHLDFANLLGGLENGLEYALNPPHYLRIVSIFRAASLLEFGTLKKWSLGCLEKQWPADLPPPSKPSLFGTAIPWAQETLAIANQLDIPQLAKRAYWELSTRPEFGRIDSEACDDEVEEILPTRSRLPRQVIMNLTRLRERLLPEWTRITRSPPVGIPCNRTMKAPSVFADQPAPCSLEYTAWYRVILEVEVSGMTIDDRWMDPLAALETMIVEIDWEKKGGFCADCVKTWKTIWTKDREKIWKNLRDWLGLDATADY